MKKIAFIAGLFILMGAQLIFAQADEHVYLVGKYKESFADQEGYLVKTGISKISPFLVTRELILSAMESCQEMADKMRMSRADDLDFMGVQCEEEHGTYLKMFQKQITGEWYLGFWTTFPENVTVQIYDFSKLSNKDFDKKSFLRERIAPLQGLENEVWVFSPTERIEIKKKTLSDFV